jgi:dTDP-D-glucose 4,6-dehydratase
MTGIARAYFIAQGQRFEYGSIREAIAISAFARQRNVDFTAALLSVVDPKKADKAIKNLREVMFPEDKYHDLRYFKDSMKLFSKTKDLTLVVRPVGD